MLRERGKTIELFLINSGKERRNVAYKPVGKKLGNPNGGVGGKKNAVVPR